MRYSFVAPAVLALVSGVVGDFFDAIQTPNRDEVLTAGVPFDLVWNPDGVTGTATLTLLEGATNITLAPGPIIAQSIDNMLGKFSWKPEDRGFATYGWQIVLDSNATDIQFSDPFHIAGKDSSSSTTTVKLSTGPSFTASTTSSSVSTVSASTTSVPLSVITSAPSNGTATLTSVQLTTIGSNTAGPTSSSSAPSSTSTTNAAGANMARGGLAAVGGLVLALAL